MSEISPEKTIFISRAGADAEFGAEVGRILEAAGYAIVLQQWDFASHNFIDRIHASLASGARVVALLSPEYLSSDYCAAEWQNAIVGDPLNTNGRLVLLRVAECEPLGLLAGLAYWDLVPICDDRGLLEEVVCNAVATGRRSATMVSTSYWRAPRTIIDGDAVRSTSNFVGRDTELATVAAALLDEDATVAVQGLGGTGKSSLAREYAWRHRDEFGVVWWLDAETESGIIDGLLRLGALLMPGIEHFAERRLAAQQVINRLLSAPSRPVLLIFDNVEELTLQMWRPRSGARLLATSRGTAWSNDVAVIPLAPLAMEDAVGYLRCESGRAHLEDGDARALAEALGGLPLALAHAAAYLRATRTVTPALYLDRINEQLAKAPRGAEYPRSVFATFQSAIAEAEARAPGSAAILCFAAQFASKGIPDELFRQSVGLHVEGLRPELPGSASPVLDLYSGLADGMRVDEALGTLDSLSLLSFSETTHTYSMHRLVQLAAGDAVGEQGLLWIESALAAASAALPRVRFESWAQCGRILEHALTALDALPATCFLATAGDVAHRCGTYLLQRGDYARAHSLLVRAVEIREKALGPTHTDVAWSLNSLAVVYRYQGRNDEVEPLYRRALEIWESALGSDHPDVAMALNNLAELLANQERYAEAQALAGRAATLRETLLGSNHPDFAHSLSGLGALHLKQGRYAEAEALLRRALTIQENVLGLHHPEVGASLHSLAELQLQKKRYEEAEPLLVRALAVYEVACKDDHPHVIYSLDSLASVYLCQRKYTEAERLIARSLKLREKTFGPGHSDTVVALERLAEVYLKQRRYADAEPLFSRALAIRQALRVSDRSRRSE